MVICITRSSSSRLNSGSQRAARLAAFAIVITGALALGSSVTHAAVVPLTPCDIAIEVTSSVPLRWSRGDVMRFREEAALIWMRSGAGVCWREPGVTCDGAGATVHVRIAERVPALPSDTDRLRNALGWIGFSRRSGPGPYIVLSVARATELLGEGRLATRRLAELPGLVERLLPRALGRALSHELGHFFLARRAHSRTGIMRETLRPDDLADDVPGYRLQLARDDERLLDLRCGPASRMAAADRP